MKIKIKSINVDVFKTFIQKLIKMDEYVYMKLSKDKVTSAVFLPERDAVKFLNVPLKDMFEFEKDLDENVKVPFYNGSRIIDALSFFDGKKIEGEIVYNKFGEEYVAEDFIIKNDKMKLKLFCADPNIDFVHMSRDEIKRAFGKDNAVFNFDLLKEDFSQINSMFKFNKELDRFKFVVNNEKLYLEGSNYEVKLKDVVDIEDEEELKDKSFVTIYKKYFQYLDKENYDVTVCTNKVIFKSLESSTLITIAVCLGEDGDDDEYYEEN